jgi:molybdenum cofactor cytidylyltransferase
LVKEKKPTAGIILAAGMSTRFGQPKQLAGFRGKPLILRTLNTVLRSDLHTVVLVLGHRHKAVAAALGKIRENPRLQIVVNHRFREGQSTSLISGVQRVMDRFSSVMFLVADQPMLDTATINRLLGQFWASGKEICVPVCHGRRGNPVIFGDRMYDRILAIQGDTGARSIIDAHPDSVLRVEIDHPLALFDIDTPDDLKALGKMIQ